MRHKLQGGGLTTRAGVLGHGRLVGATIAAVLTYGLMGEMFVVWPVQRPDLGCVMEGVTQHTGLLLTLGVIAYAGSVSLVAAHAPVGAWVGRVTLYAATTALAGALLAKLYVSVRVRFIPGCGGITLCPAWACPTPWYVSAAYLLVPAVFAAMLAPLVGAAIRFILRKG